MTNMNIFRNGAKAPGMESTPVSRKTDSSTVSQNYAVLGASAVQLDDTCSVFKGASWGDIMLDLDNGPRTPPATTITRSVVSREEFLFRYYIDLATDPWKYGDLEEEMVSTKAELQDMGEWPNVIAHLIYLEEEKMRIEEERVANTEKLNELDRAMEEKRAKHKLKIVAMEEAGRQQVIEDKIRAVAKVAARQVATVKDGDACKYYRDDGTPAPAREGWEAGCGYHKEGKCTHVHPDELGWDAAVVKRNANRCGHRHGPRGGDMFHKPGGNGKVGNWRV